MVQARKIIHIDMDAFYASVEQRDFPEYRNRPIAVGGSPAGRGVVATCSYEARKYGVHSAMPSSQAIKRCPQLVFIKPRFEVYRQISKQVRAILYEYTELVEPLSLDEAYLDVTENKIDMPSATIIARQIKEKIHNKTQLVASAGVSYCKFLAKIASDLDKPDGLAVIKPQQAQGFIDQLEIGSFHGIGKSTEQKMLQHGIEKGVDLKQKSEIDLVRIFGKQGHYFYKIARGIDDRAVKPHRIRKSIGKERTFSNDIDDLNWIRSFLDELAQKVITSMEKHNIRGKIITLKIRYADFENQTKSRTLTSYTRNHKQVMSVIYQLLNETEVGKRKVRLLGITLSELDVEIKRAGVQLKLPFEEDNIG